MSSIIGRVAARLRVNGRDGSVPLLSIASLSLSSGPSQIERYDRRRFVTINADLGGTPLGTATNAAIALPAVRGMPSSVSLIQGSDAEIAGELASGFGRHPLHLLCAGATVQGFPAADYDPFGDIAFDRRRVPRIAGRPQRTRRAGDDRPRHADGDRNQELDPASRMCRGGHEGGWPVESQDGDRCVPQARPTASS